MSNPNQSVKIHIDKVLYTAPLEIVTGAKLKNLGSVKAGMDLFQKVPGKDDRLINDGDSVTLKNGDQFYSAPSSLNPGSNA